MTLRFLSRGEIAEHLGVTLGTVKQYANFPEPDVIVGRNQGWAVQTVDQWAHNRNAVRASGRALRADAVTAPGVPVVDCGLGVDIRAGAVDSSGREPSGLSAAPVSGAGSEATESSLGSLEQFVGSGIHEGASVVSVRIGTEVDLTQRPRGIDRRGRGA